ncbi:uncharacterized protein BT62DRAFT_916687 [Guyanagaster necrorhizus]|uniref:Uncharacterized protein n=1 Tax=Guyanagaster necrorhizus TaxID=856835 RepID=A0A9P8AW41_9AGAR|nr:uncharacterized protein BT62DRAFT_916687 [Guyanagaster necrorhizus MCA 3950]KAG7450183.1 hypothetical protein BT62DRAFT_916687 [Guyanagaster necrorhizus MCA 3950]
MPVTPAWDANVLSTLTFHPDSTFLADEVAVIATVTSEAANEYSPLTYQCYWFAKTIFNIIVEMQVGKYTKRPEKDNKHMGKHGSIRIVGGDASNIFMSGAMACKSLIQPYHARWEKWLNEVKAMKEKKEEPLIIAEQAKRDAQRGAEEERKTRLDAQQELASLQKEFDDYKQNLHISGLSSSQSNAL